MKKIYLLIISGTLMFTLTCPASANKNLPASAFFDAALCQPPYSFGSILNLYGAAEKLGKIDKSKLGAAVFHLAAPIKKDGFVAQDIVFISDTIGVLIEGNVAEKLAAKYNLAPEEFNIINMSGFVRQLPDAQQRVKELGLISLVALQSSAFKDKTLLGCQFVSNADREGMEFLKKE